MRLDASKNIWRSACMLVLWLTWSSASGGDVPWGRSQEEVRDYGPQKVVYDVATSDEKAFQAVLDRVSYLNLLYEADPFSSSLVLVLHGAEIGFFAIENTAEHEDLMTRAQSLTLSGPIEFRVCKLAAQSQGYAPADLHGFVQVVPMADAEIIRLQRDEGYAYMR